MPALMSLLILLSCPPLSQAAIHDRVVAFVETQAITLSEFEEQFKKTTAVSPGITAEEVLDTMVNRILLLKEAKKYRIEAPTPEEVLKEYIDLKVRSFIRVSDSAGEDFYKKNTSEFGGREYDKVRGEIESYLTEKMLNEKLKEILRDLRKGAYIKIQLK
jgi:hypothetical protein